LPVDRFQFLGFLPARDKSRRECLENALAGAGTIVFFEAPHRLRDTLKTIAALVGDDRRIVVAKELTKVHERIEFGAVHEVMARLAANDALERGEFVCMIETGNRAPLASHAARVMDVLLGELPPAQAARLGAKLTETPRNELYEYAVSVSDHSPGQSGKRRE
jgi:16S rRNA (cytidine1402-2'-O)-methyltransferase